MSATILLVDDDEVLSQVLTRVLSRQGYRVVQGTSVATAVQLAREHRPQLALLDLRLPDGDGVELADRLEREVGPMPLILMTAYPLRLRDHPELARHFRRVLTKPLNLEELRQTIDSALNPTEPAPVSAEPKPVAAIEPPPAPPAPAPSVDTTPSHYVPPPETRPSRRSTFIAAILGAGFIAAGLLLILPALGVPIAPNVLAMITEKPESSGSVAPTVKPLADAPDFFDVDPSVLAALQVGTPVEVPKPARPRKLELAGSLNFDPNTLGRIQSRFAGEVIELGKNENGINLTSSADRDRPLKYGDPVKKGQLLAVVWSKDLGEKKSELVDAMVTLAADELDLTKKEAAFKEGAAPEASVRQARAKVSSDLNIVNAKELTLRIWRLTPEEIEAVKTDAREIIARKQRDLLKESFWARVEVRAPFDGVIVEKNLTAGVMVDPTVDLYKISAIEKLAVQANVYEEDLLSLRMLREQLHSETLPWTVAASADPKQTPLTTWGIERINLVVDPNQHTALVMGHVANPPDAVNPHGKYQAGQFVNCTIEIPAPADVVSVPIESLVTDGKTSVVFVQPHRGVNRFERRRVVLRGMFAQFAYVASTLTPQQIKDGFKPIHFGDLVVREGSLQLKAALDDAQAGQNSGR
jgi:membrane fusion protein, heavy metal efflux system